MTREQELLTALEAALEYLDAIPKDAAAAFPAMPGFDRDHVDELVFKARHDMAVDPLPIEGAEKLMNRLYDVLDASGSYAMEVASKRGLADPYGRQADECSIIIRSLVGDARYYHNPLREVIAFAASQITKQES